MGATEYRHALLATGRTAHHSIPYACLAMKLLALGRMAFLEDNIATCAGTAGRVVLALPVRRSLVSTLMELQANAIAAPEAGGVTAR